MSLIDELQLVLTDPDSELSDESERALCFVIDRLKAQQQAACIACGKASGHESWCARQRWGIGRTTQAEAPSEDGRFLLLPQRPKPEWPASNGFPHDRYSGAQMLTFGRECSDAALATHPAPEQMERDHDCPNCSGSRFCKRLECNEDSAREAQATKGGEAA